MPNPLTPLFPTEAINPNTRGIDQLSTAALLAKINQEDQGVALAVQKAIPAIAVVVDRIVQSMEQGGHLFYFGAGTSGRLGVLDASECPPTFGVDPTLVQGFIAGGETALRYAVEGAEDSEVEGREDAQKANLTCHDVVVGLSASGGAPYVLGALQQAKLDGAFTVGFTCNPTSLLVKSCDQPIVVEVGPEVIAGSTRLKAGTAQKLVLNMLTTGAMIQLGKTYENLMVDVQPTNQKLRQRACRMVASLSGASLEQAQTALVQSGYQVKPAVLMLCYALSLEEAQAQLKRASGKLRTVLLEKENASP